MSVELGTKQKALREANALLQKFGFNGFSFQHIADSLGIKKPSLYAHFESKEALGIDLIDAYRQSLVVWGESMSELSPELKVSAYFDMFFRFSQKGLLYCPLASLAAEAHSLPLAMKKKVKALHEYQMNWLRKAVDEGKADGIFRKDFATDEQVEFLVALGIGAQFVARVSNEAEKVKTLKKHAIAYLKLSN